MAKAQNSCLNEGPYRVVKVLGNDCYKLALITGFQGMKNKRRTTVASDRMRPWIHIASLDLDRDASDNENDERNENIMSE